MLFTDGTILTQQDLREHDNFILEIASTESIELSSKLAIAQRAIGYELASFLTNRETPVPLGRVVVNDELRDLLAIQTLALVYRDAYNRHLNDRYAGRVKEFSEATERGFRRLLHNGVGVVSLAVARAEAPTVNIIDGNSPDAGLYTVQIAWQHVAGGVGERSNLVSTDSAGGNLIVVPPSAPPNMAGWHVFIGLSDAVATRQNNTVIAVDAHWTQAASLRQDLSGPDPSDADYYVRQSAQLVRR